MPNCAKLDDATSARLKGAPLLFFDGTLYTNDEMIVQGLMNKTGERIGHMNMSGAERHDRAPSRDSGSGVRSSSTSTIPIRRCARIRPSGRRLSVPAGKSPMMGWTIRV